MNNKIFVDIFNNFSILRFPDYNIETFAFIGKNGVTKRKKEGDGKTPLGMFNFGIILGTHPPCKINSKLNYLQINKNMYWVDDCKSKYYNKLVDITKLQKDWHSAEHLIDFPVEYEYLIEIKTNPNYLKGHGSAIFLHCSNNRPTQGCISIDKFYMKKIITLINNETNILIQKRPLLYDKSGHADVDKAFL